MGSRRHLAVELAVDPADADGLSEKACLLQAVEDANDMSPTEFLETYGADAFRSAMRQSQQAFEC